MYKKQSLLSLQVCFKIYLFYAQFKLTTRELQALRSISLFTVTIYVKAWLSTPNSYDAPLNDLLLLQAYVDVDRQLAEVAMKKMSSGEKLTFDEMKLIYAEESD